MKKFLYLSGLVCIILCSLVAYKFLGGELPSEEQKEDIMYMVSHSEYWSGEEGQVITRLLNYRGEPISANYCRAYITYPNKTRFVDGDLMASSPVDSTYYYTFDVPDTEGVFEYMTLCNYGNDVNRTAMNSFHVSPALNFQRVLEDTISSGYENITENLSQIRDDTNFIRDNMNVNYTQDYSSIIERLDNIANFCGNNYTSSSALCQWVNETNERVENIESEVTIGFTNLQNNVTYYYNATVESIEQLEDTIDAYHDEVMDIIEEINDTVTETDEKVDLILDMLNISLDNINIYAESSGNCIIGSNWQLYAAVEDEIGRTLTDEDVYCEATTNFWGGPVNMSWDMLDLRFEYLHNCDTEGTILWQVMCDAI